jgi:hypothetical protein
LECYDASKPLPFSYFLTDGATFLVYFNGSISSGWNNSAFANLNSIYGNRTYMYINADESRFDIWKGEMTGKAIVGTFGQVDNNLHLATGYSGDIISWVPDDGGIGYVFNPTAPLPPGDNINSPISTVNVYAYEGALIEAYSSSRSTSSLFNMNFSVAQIAGGTLPASCNWPITEAMDTSLGGSVVTVLGRG